jgi:ParB-like chromosome segregation protein Spo0J
MVVDTIDNIKINEEYASLFPQLSELEFQKLKEFIKTNGLWYPIIVNKDGIVLDGHHRFKACQELGIKEPKIETKEFADPLLENKFIIESNLERRQLNDFQRIELALKLKPIFKEIAKKNMSLG